MAEHLTAAEVEQYQNGGAEPSTLLAWDEHLAACAECRQSLAPHGSLAQWAEGLRNPEEQSHLNYEQLVERMEGRVPTDRQFALESHLRQCETCREDLADLTQFRAGMKKPAGWIWIAATAAALVLVAAGSLIFRNPAQGPLKLADNWGTRDRSIVEQALAAGRLPFAALPTDVAARPGTLLGPSTPNLFAPLAPIAALVEPGTPEFRWQELPGTVSYQVEVFDADFHRVARSPQLSGTAWTPAQPLARGKLYQWQVTAVRGGETIRVPSPPAPDAKFRVLDASTEQRIAAARVDGSTGRLLAAVIFAQQGMKPEAMRELDLLPKDVQNRPEVRKLREAQ